MSSFTYFEEWATPKKWAYEWAYISPQPTHLSASLPPLRDEARRDAAKGMLLPWNPTPVPISSVRERALAFWRPRRQPVVASFLNSAGLGEVEVQRRVLVGALEAARDVREEHLRTYGERISVTRTPVTTHNYVH